MRDLVQVIGPGFGSMAISGAPDPRSFSTRQSPFWEANPGPEVLKLRISSRHFFARFFFATTAKIVGSVKFASAGQCGCGGSQPISRSLFDLGTTLASQRKLQFLTLLYLSSSEGFGSIADLEIRKYKAETSQNFDRNRPDVRCRGSWT